MNKLGFVTLWVVLLTGLAGCRNPAPRSWFHPGSAAYQQSMAEQFDPYPENEPAPPIVGARPLEYENPRAEVLRARWLPWNWQWR